MENYIGPFWSDGKWQESVEFGNANPLSDVDAASRLHDSAYARYKDEAHRIAADEIYSETLKKLKGPNTGLADVPLFGNYVKNRLLEIGGGFASGFKSGGLFGGLGSLVYNGVKGIVRSNDLIKNGSRYRREVLDYYDTDPYKKPIVSEKKIQRNIIVSIPKPIAPLQTQTDNEEMFKRNKVQPTSVATTTVRVKPAKPQGGTRYTPPPPASKRESDLMQRYRPLKGKKNRIFAARDYMLYLDFHPGEVERVARWLEKHPLQ